MITAISIISFFCLFLLFVKYEWGVGIYILIFFLVPFYYLYLGGFKIGENLLSLILLLLLFVWALNREGISSTGFSLLTPFLFLFFIQALLIPFHITEMPLSEQFKLFRIDIMRLFLPFVMISLADYDKRNASIFTYSMYLAIAIASLYGIFLILIPGQNPYIDAINPVLEYDIGDQEKVLEEGIRVFGYISSVYPHVTEYGYFLVFSSVFLLYQFKRDTSIIPKVLFGLVLINVVVCGSRSVLMAEGIVLFVYLLYNRQIRVLITAAVLVTAAWLFVKRFMPEYVLFLNSIGDESIAGGSSIDLRMGQFRGCFNALKDHPIFGLGYGWAGWYRSTIGRHPTMLSFESCLIQILCNNGIMGLLVWGIMVVLVFKTVSKHFEDNREIKRAISLLLIAYFSYTFFTGDYGTFRAMIIFYALIIANEMSYEDEDLQEETEEDTDSEDIICVSLNQEE